MSHECKIKILFFVLRSVNWTNTFNMKVISLGRLAEKNRSTAVKKYPCSNSSGPSLSLPCELSMLNAQTVFEDIINSSIIIFCTNRLGAGLCGDEKSLIDPYLRSFLTLYINCWTVREILQQTVLKVVLNQAVSNVLQLAVKYCTKTFHLLYPVVRLIIIVQS